MRVTITTNTKDISCLSSGSCHHSLTIHDNNGISLPAVLSRHCSIMISTAHSRRSLRHKLVTLTPNKRYSYVNVVFSSPGVPLFNVCLHSIALSMKLYGIHPRVPGIFSLIDDKHYSPLVMDPAIILPTRTARTLLSPLTGYVVIHRHVA